MLRYLMWGVLAIAVLAALDRVLLWMESRGWINYRRSGLSRVGAVYHMFELHSVFDPGIEHAAEARYADEKGEDESGDPPGRPGDPSPARPPIPTESVEVAESPIEGLGVFATMAFEPGDTVLVLDTSRVVDEAHPLRPEHGESEDHLAYLADGVTVLLPEPERHLNHSCDPNSYLKTMRGDLHVVARRRIEPGEEVTIDYLINTHGGSRWECACGTERCRGLLEASFFDLPLEVQAEYLPLLEDWFVDEHRSAVARLKERLGDGNGAA